VQVQDASERKLRSDARRNRERLLASAREVLARDGLDASVEEITREAGLGMGTLYRHFPTKAELVDAVLEDAFAQLVDAAEEGVAAQDPWNGFAGFLEHALSLHASNRSLKDVLATTESGRRRAEAMRTRIRPLLRTMVERAHAQGSLRPDFTAEDVPMLFWTSGRVIEVTEGVASGYWRRFLGLVLDGLRTGSATPLPRPSLTSVQLARAVTRRDDRT